MIVKAWKHVVIAALSAAAIAGAHAASFKWAAQDDAATMDPHAFNHGMTLTVLNNIYEGLVRRDRNARIQPALAASWSNPDPNTWRFQIRKSVAFHDGSTLTPEDVVFSIKRAMAKTSDMKVFAASIADVKVSGPMQVDIQTETPNSALLQSLAELRIMSKSWCETNKATSPADLRAKSENYATRNANGTGPFKLSVREPDIKTVLVANTKWWDTPKGNVTEATLVRIASAPTRVAALLSGEVDFAYPIPLQDIERVNSSGNLKVVQGPEIRTMFLSMDQVSPELRYADVKGKNPFADRRVRQAIYQAIDVESIKARIQRNSVMITGSMLPEGVNSVDSRDKGRPYPYDVSAAKRLLAEAGYPNGFTVTLDCPNDRYINDEQVCNAVAAMLAKLPIKVEVNAMPSSKFFQKVGSLDSSFNFFGYTPVNLDAYNTLNVTMMTRSDKNGQWNVGRYSNPKIDEIIGEVLSEMDPEKRMKLVSQAVAIHKQDIGHIPLYQQGISWGMKRTIDTPLQIDNRVNLNFTTVR